MSNSRLIGVVATIIVLALVIFGVYHFRGRAPSTEPKPPAEQSEQTPEPPKTGPETATAPEAKPEAAAPKAEAPQVPSFDVVRVEGTGEGVMAGRGTPGWTIKIESNGNVIAETKVDDDGAWSIVLDKPLPAGKHKLALRAISPDGTSALTAQQPVSVTVEGPAAVAEAPAKEPSAAPQVATEKPRPIAVKDVQYNDTGPDAGKLVIVGEGEPGASILLFLDEESLGQVTIAPDGTWTFEADKKLGDGDHSIRADKIEAGTGVVVARTFTAFRRVAPSAAASAQPRPVYPGGQAPETSPPPPTSMAAMPQPSEAGQPKPVYPGGPSPAAEAPSATVATADSSQPKPVYPGEAATEAATPATTPSTPPTSVASSTTPSEASQPKPVSPGPPAGPEVPPTAVASADTSQPEPAYPSGAPAPAAEPAPAPAQGASTEAPSEATQPQPARPAETAAAEPEQPSPAAEATPESGAVTAERPGETTGARVQPSVVFRSAEFEEVGTDSAKVRLSGTGDPGARILLFFDDAPLGEVTADSDGNWSFEAEQKVDIGDHVVRADRIEGGTGKVLDRAAIAMGRMEKPAPEQEVAAQEPAPAATPEGSKEEPLASEEAEPAAPAVKTAQRRRSRVYTVRRGDTLWEIAEYYYGGGWRYRTIVRQNRRKIKDPHWIYPRQKFTIPRRG